MVKKQNGIMFFGGVILFWGRKRIISSFFFLKVINCLLYFTLCLQYVNLLFIIVYKNACNYKVIVPVNELRIFLNEGNHMGKRMKIAFIASSGGHLEEIESLKNVKEKYDSFLITEGGRFSDTKFCEKIYLVWQMNRKQVTFLPKFLILLLKAIHILNKEKPDFIITTGALVAYPFCVVGKLKGIKIIYVESFARVKKPSLTGRLLYNFADLFIVQWEDMLKLYPKSVLGGGIF